MIVTRIEDFSRGKGRVSIYLNNEFAFVLYKGELSDYGIDIGESVDEEQYRRILDNTLIPRAKKRGMNLLMKQDRTQSDITNKLSDSGYPQEAIDAAIDYLKSFHYIDDYRYASNYIHYKSSSMSIKQIQNKLSEKGVDRAVIEAALNEYSIENESLEHQLIEKLILKRTKGILPCGTYEDKQKLYAYLYNKGFSISDIERVYTEMCDLT